MVESNSTLTVTYTIPPDAVLTSGVHQTGQPPGVVGLGGTDLSMVTPEVKFLQDFGPGPYVFDATRTDLNANASSIRQALSIVSLYRGFFEAALAGQTGILNLENQETIPPKGGKSTIVVSYIMDSRSFVQTSGSETAGPPQYPPVADGSPDGSKANPYVFDATNVILGDYDLPLRKRAAVTTIFRMVFEAEFARQNYEILMYPNDVPPKPTPILK